MSLGNHGPDAVSFQAAAIPPVGPVGTSATWVGIQFGVESDLVLAGTRVYVDLTEDGGYYWILWNRDTFEIVRAGVFRVRATTGNKWHQGWFRPYFRIAPGSIYRFAVLFAAGRYFRTTNFLSGGSVTRHNLTIENGFQTTALSPPSVAITLNGNLNAVDLLWYTA